MALKKINLKDVTMGPIRDRVLPVGFIERVQKYKQVLAEVEKSNLEETVANFQRDNNPERELEIWEGIASIYKSQLDRKPQMSLPEKREVYKLLLTTSIEG